MKNTIICAIDVGTRARAVIEASVEVARRAGARVLLVHAGKTTEAHLWAVEEMLNIADDIDVDVLVTPGCPCEVIARTARRTGAMLVALGASTSRWWSVSRALLRLLGQPLLVVRDAAWCHRWAAQMPIRLQPSAATGPGADAVRRWSAWLASLGPTNTAEEWHGGADIAVAWARSWRWRARRPLQDAGSVLVVAAA